jgi:hypothetical protein
MNNLLPGPRIAAQFGCEYPSNWRGRPNGYARKLSATGTFSGESSVVGAPYSAAFSIRLTSVADLDDLINELYRLHRS